jgi:hypothetical protein
MSNRQKPIPPKRRQRALSRCYDAIGIACGSAAGLAEILHATGDADYREVKAISRQLDKAAERFKPLIDSARGSK